jgi:hypothetical protein
MGKHHKHHVKVHQWKHGRLTVAEHEFNNFELAMAFAHKLNGLHINSNYEVPTDQVVKVYDSEDNSMVESIGSSTLDSTYA